VVTAEVVVLRTGVCIHCTERIELHVSDLDPTPHWTHIPDDGEGRYRDECRASTYATPAVPHQGDELW